jgi:hypothetical protein
MALKKKITNKVGQSTEYHRINRVEIDFKREQIHIYMESYSDDSYRSIEKDQETKIKSDIVKYYNLANELSNLEASINSYIGKAELTDEEVNQLTVLRKEYAEKRNDLAQLNIQELEAYKVESVSAKTELYTLPLTDDLRANLYDRIKNEIEPFNDSENI